MGLSRFSVSVIGLTYSETDTWPAASRMSVEDTEAIRLSERQSPKSFNPWIKLARLVGSFSRSLIISKTASINRRNTSGEILRRFRLKRFEFNTANKTRDEFLLRQQTRVDVNQLPGTNCGSWSRGNRCTWRRILRITCSVEAVKRSGEENCFPKLDAT